MNTLKKLLCFSLIFCMIFSCVNFAREEIPVPTTPQSTTTQSSTTQAGTTQATPPVNAEPDTSNYPKTFYDIDYSTPLGIALEALTERDIITGFPDGSFKSNQSLTRAEFSKIIVCFAAGGTAVNSVSGFPDVDNVGSSPHWAQPYIKTAKDMGIISGFPDGTFKPDSPVTYEQAVKMIMCALNYKDYTYPDGFMQIALQKKLFVNSTHQGLNSDNINRGTVSILVYNAFSISPKTEISIGGDLSGGSFGGGGGGGSSSGGSGGSGGGGGSSSFTRKIFGIVWGNTNTDLDFSSNSLLDNELKIKYDEKSTDPETGEEITITKTEVFPVSDKYTKNLNAFLGKNVRIDLSEDDRGNEYISYLLALESNNSSTYVDFSSRKSLALDSESGIYTFEYYDSNDNVKKITLENDEPVYIIYNGKSIRYNADSEYEFDPTCLSDPKIGNAEFLSNDGDKKSNIIFITSYETAVVSSRSTSSNGDYILKFKHNIPELNIGPLEGYDSFRNIIITSQSGMKIKPSSIVKGDVIDYASSKDGSTLNIIVNQSISNNVSGSVSKEISNNKISIRKSNSETGTVYELNYSYINYLNEVEDDDKYIPQRNDNVKIRLNSFNKVADIEKVTTSISEKYGYIVSAGFSTGSGWIDADDLLDNPDAKIMLKLHEMDKNGASKTGINSSLVPISSTVTIDGIVYKNPAAVEERLRKAALLANTGKSLSRAEYASFIRFSTTGGSISYIDTILDGQRTSSAAISTESDEDYNTLIRSSFVYNSIGDDLLEGKHKFYYATSSTSGFYKTSSSDRVRCNSYTKYLFVPSSMSKETSFKSGKYDYKNFNNDMTYYIEAYNVTSTQNNAEFLIQYITEGTETVSAYSNVAIIKNVNDPTSSEQGSVVCYLMPGSTSISGSTSPITVTVSEGSPAESKMRDLSAGDVILYSVLNNQIYDYYLALDADNLPVKRIDSYDNIYSTASINDRRIKGFDVYPDDAVQNTEKYARFRTIYGTVVDYDSTAKILSVNPALSTDHIDSPSNAYTEDFLISTSNKVYVYTETSQDPKLECFTSSTFFSTSYEGEFTTAEDLDGSYGGASHVFIYTYGGNLNSDPYLKFIYVINAPSQQNSPSNYDDSSDTDSILENAKASAIGEIQSYKTNESYTYTMYSSDLTSVRNAAISEIESAETVIEVNNALVAGKNYIDNIPDDNAKTRAIEAVSTYINSYDYPSIEEEILEIISQILDAINSDEVDTNEEILALVDEGRASLDDLISLTETKDDAKSELDSYLDLLETESDADFSSDETLSSLVELLKAAIDASSNEGSVNDALTEAKAQLDDYVSSHYPDSSEEIE